MTYFPCASSAYLTLFVYLLALLVMWIAIYFQHSRKKKLTKVRFTLCFLMSAVYIGVVYNATFIRHFHGYKTERENGRIEVQYLFPQRTKTLMVQDISTVKSEPSYKGSYQTVIIMKNGRRHEGVPSKKYDADGAAEKIRSAMP